MSGILDSKTRVFDIILTNEGRRQIANGDLRIEHVSFSDDATFYKQDLVSGSEDTSLRLFFEASNLPQDNITFEANNVGNIQPFKNINGINVSNGQILSTSYDAQILLFNTNYSVNNQTLTGSQFTSNADDLLQSSIDNFQSLRLLGTLGDLLDDDNFVLSKNDVTFNVTTNSPIPQNFKTYNYLASVEGLISDIRLSDQTNFKFLPPLNKQEIAIDTTNPTNYSDYLLADYKCWGLKQPISINDIVSELQTYDKLGMSKEVLFNRTSQQNNIIGQIFEITNSEIKKLDIIDFGRKPINLNGNITWTHVYFVGKVFVDDNGDDTYIHMFTLVFS